MSFLNEYLDFVDSKEKAAILEKSLLISEEKLFISEKCHLLPKYSIDKSNFIDLYTGLELKKAYLINKKYGSYLDPSIAVSHLKFLLNNDLISLDLFKQFNEMIKAELKIEEDQELYFINDLVNVKKTTECLIKNTKANEAYESHLETAKHLGTNKLLLYSVDQILKEKKENNSNKKRKIDTNNKKINLYILNTEDKNQIEEINNQNCFYLDEPFTLKSIYLNFNHGGFYIYLEDDSSNIGDNINPYANNLNHGSDHKFFGKVLMLTNKSLYPDGESNKKKKIV